MTAHARVFVSVEDAAAFAESVRQRGRRVVFTSGAFDLLHPAHVRFLQAARAEGDVLMVALSSDRSVRATSGPGHPVLPEAERAELVAALACVDGVVVFDEDTPDRVVLAILPDVLVKGADSTYDASVGRDAVEGRGGRVVSAPNEAGCSATDIVSRVKRLQRKA